MSSGKGGQLLLCWFSITAAPALLGWNDEMAQVRGESVAGSRPKVRHAAALVLFEMGECKASAYSTASLGAIAQIEGPDHVRRGDRVLPNAPKDVLDLKSAPLQRQVIAISHCGETYRIRTADGGVSKIAELDLHFGTDSSDLGPRPGRPVIVDPDAQGSPAVIVFAAAREISSFISEACPMRGDEAPF